MTFALDSSVNGADILSVTSMYYEFPLGDYQIAVGPKLDSDDLNYIWQNLAPRNYQKITKTHSSIAHKLGDNELLTRDEFIDENTRWMIFKVKQRGQTQYKDTTISQVGQAKSNNQEENNSNGYRTEFNWPYDYVSFVESIVLDAKALYKKPVDEE